MLTEQIFCQDRGHEQVLSVSQDKFYRGQKWSTMKPFLAERLWSPMEINDPKAALPRINEWRCHMVKRGLPAEPNLANINVEGYHKYGYCPEPHDPFNINFFW